MGDGCAERPVGLPTGIRSAAEIERVAHPAPTPGAEDQREAQPRDDRRDADGRTDDRAPQGHGAQPDGGSQRGRIGDGDRPGAAVHDPHRAVGGRLRARIAELHAHGYANARHGQVAARCGGRHGRRGADEQRAAGAEQHGRRPHGGASSMVGARRASRARRAVGRASGERVPDAATPAHRLTRESRFTSR
jgi:hypothetical protein